MRNHAGEVPGAGGEGGVSARGGWEGGREVRYAGVASSGSEVRYGGVASSGSDTRYGWGDRARSGAVETPAWRTWICPLSWAYGVS